MKYLITIYLFKIWRIHGNSCQKGAQSSFFSIYLVYKKQKRERDSGSGVEKRAGFCSAFNTKHNLYLIARVGRHGLLGGVVCEAKFLLLVLF